MRSGARPDPALGRSPPHPTPAATRSSLCAPCRTPPPPTPTHPQVYYIPRVPFYAQSTLPTFVGTLRLLRCILLREGITLVHAHQVGAPHPARRTPRCLCHDCCLRRTRHQGGSCLRAAHAPGQWGAATQAAAGRSPSSSPPALPRAHLAGVQHPGA
jgi:hypothetical protein